MRGDESRSPLDSLIDEVARAKTEGGPSPKLRARVAERIAWSHRAGRVAPWTVALATVSIVAIAAMLWPRTDRHVERDRHRQMAQASSPSAASAQRRVEVASMRPVDRPTRFSFRATAMRQELSVPVTTAGTIESLQIGPIAIEQVEPELVVLDAIAGPMLLGIEQLQIEPLSLSSVE